MNSNNHVSGQAMKGVYAIIEGLPVLKSRKDPAVAGILGFMFGGIGLGFYFLNPLDFVLPIAMWFIVGILAAPTGELLFVLGPVFTAIYGYKRALSSNRRLTESCASVTASAAPSAYSHDKTPPVITSVPPPLPPIIELASLKCANVSTTEMKLNRAKDLLGKGLIAQSEYESIRAKILSEI